MSDDIARFAFSFLAIVMCYCSKTTARLLIFFLEMFSLSAK